jgi:nicotinamide-nucleotide amidase
MAAQGVPAAAVRTWHVYGMGESHIDHRLAKLLDGIPNATLHFRTDVPENHVKVIIRGPDTGRNQALLEQVDRDLRKRIGPGIYGIDGETFPLVVGQALRSAGATLALAESCTGGEAGQMITSEPGASDFFVGSVVAYSNDVKVNVLGVKAATIAESGAVSEPCAKEMAEGARRVTGATIAVSITGVAGPAKESDTSAAGTGDKPVGTVCFALASAKSTKAVSKLFSGDRARIRRAAAYFALDLARRHSQ